MLETAKIVIRYWFPTQSQELALYCKSRYNMDFDAIPAREAVGSERFSGNGFTQVHEWLASNGKLDTLNQNDSSCGV
ncbi:MAG: hypothetical protein IT328_23640 [Caldilineaceae bacterium]|nr:hypothetical protein [Caldilineaceae bacterium]